MPANGDSLISSSDSVVFPDSVQYCMVSLSHMAATLSFAVLPQRHDNILVTIMKHIESQKLKYLPLCDNRRDEDVQAILTPFHKY